MEQIPFSIANALVVYHELFHHWLKFMSFIV